MFDTTAPSCVPISFLNRKVDLYKYSIDSIDIYNSIFRLKDIERYWKHFFLLLGNLCWRDAALCNTFSLKAKFGIRYKCYPGCTRQDPSDSLLSQHILILDADFEQIHKNSKSWLMLMLDFDPQKTNQPICLGTTKTAKIDGNKSDGCLVRQLPFWMPGQDRQDRPALALRHPARGRHQNMAGNHLQNIYSTCLYVDFNIWTKMKTSTNKFN